MHGVTVLVLRMHPSWNSCPGPRRSGGENYTLTMRGRNGERGAEHPEDKGIPAAHSRYAGPGARRSRTAAMRPPPGSGEWEWAQSSGLCGCGRRWDMSDIVVYRRAPDPGIRMLLWAWVTETRNSGVSVRQNHAWSDYWSWQSELQHEYKAEG